jgi:hypothetical protein
MLESLVRIQELYVGAALDKQSMIHDRVSPEQSGGCQGGCVASEVVLDTMPPSGEAMAAFYVEAGLLVERVPVSGR